jgi:phenylalanyl-tRNA synthetase beta chain
MERLLGYAPGPDEVRASLAAVGLGPEPSDVSARAGGFAVTVPSWRADLAGEADLVEEVARHLGYDRIPAPRIEVAAVDPAAGLEEASRDVLAGHGFHEAIGYSMIGAGEDDAWVPAGTRPGWRLTNPIAEPLAVLRRSMLPGLVRAADLNFRRGARDVRLFEIGHVFLREGGAAAPDEPSRVGIVWSGAGRPRHWSEVAPEVGFDDLAGLVELVLERGRPGAGLARQPDELGAFHPGVAARWQDGEGRTVARAGALHPAIQERLDHAVLAAEIDLGALAAVAAPPLAARRLTRFPSVARDLALVLSPARSYAEILRAMHEVPAPAPVTFDAIDRYVGPPLAAGESSLTVRVVLEPTDGTLTDEEVERYRADLVRSLADRAGVRIR